MEILATFIATTTTKCTTLPYAHILFIGSEAAEASCWPPVPFLLSGCEGVGAMFSHFLWAYVGMFGVELYATRLNNMQTLFFHTVFTSFVQLLQ